PILPIFNNKKEEKIYRDTLKKKLLKYSLSNDSKNPAKSLNISLEQLLILDEVINKFGKLDIRDITGKDLINKEIDLFTYSFPCQNISQQGKRDGFSKGGEGKRSGLLWEIERILKEIKSLDKSRLPKVLMMENVKAILNEEFKSDLDLWINELEKIGYKNTKPFIINSSNVGSPQSRSRVFMVSKLDGNIEEFPEEENIKNGKLLDILQKVEKREILDKSKYLGFIKNEPRNKNTIKKATLQGYTTFMSENYVYYKDGLVPTITASGAQSRIKFFEDNGDICYLNSLEHLLLQDFPKSFYEKLKKLNFTETKIKFLAGNSINVKVLEKIFEFYLK
ncbi:MAG: DNA (cytosine-5-)-methyltransferase, partial [Candidatus Gracilibacteria bacterium]|nr:DNA (cytosine-5-)-methyltransferase [Candidatus Gracilibacteria bacterium]